MKVHVNNRAQILKSFLDWLPLAIAAIIFYGALFVAATLFVLAKFLSEESARQFAPPIGGALLVLFIYLYLSYLVRSLSAYQLKIENEKLFVKGISGWRTIEKILPITEVEKIYIGSVQNKLEKLSAHHGSVQDQVQSRLTFFLKNDKPFKIDFAAKAFCSESLLKFLLKIKEQGVDTNVYA